MRWRFPPVFRRMRAMQEQEIVTLIESLYATFLNGDLSPIFDIVSDDTISSLPPQ